MQKILHSNHFLDLAAGSPVLDVRSPAEFSKGHIPGAINRPLFSDEERALIGKIYVKQGREPAVLKGFELTGAKLHSYFRDMLKTCPDKKALLYCWRGGMRSRSVAFMLDMAGYDSFLLEGGYKSYRNLLLESFGRESKLIVLGGLTGSGKTELLLELERRGEQVLDIEGIARHKGSAFGHLGQEEQPSAEHFQNLLFEKWRTFDFTRRIFVEDENSDLGKVNLPEPLFRKIRTSKIIILEVPVSARVQKLVEEYTGSDDALLIASVKRLERRLGSENMNKAISAISNGDYSSACEILLTYYDKAYRKSTENRDKQKVTTVSSSCVNALMNADLILKEVNGL